jgi:hypothetical protein
MRALRAGSLWGLRLNAGSIRRRGNSRLPCAVPAATAQVRISRR